MNSDVVGANGSVNKVSAGSGDRMSRRGLKIFLALSALILAVIVVLIALSAGWVEAASQVNANAYIMEHSADAALLKEAVGNVKIQMGTDEEAAQCRKDASSLGLMRVGLLVLLIAAVCVIGVLIKKPDKKNALLIACAVFLVLLVGVVFLTYRVDCMNEKQLTLEQTIFNSVEAQGAEVTGPSYRYTDSKGVEKIVMTAPADRALGTYRAIHYVSLSLLFIYIVYFLWRIRGERDLIFPIVNTLVLILLMFITLYPVINTVAYSLNEGMDALKGGIGLWPRVFSVEAYQTLLTGEIYHSAWISFAKTVSVTVLNLFFTSMLAFALSRREYVLRKFITTVLVLTMYVNAGLIPNFLLVSKTLGLKGTFWAYVLPAMFSCFNMIVMRTYITGLPEALVESARIDGASDMRTFFQIILPLMKPVLATVALFVAVGAWNSWFDTYLYNGSKKELYTLQYQLKMRLATTQNSASAANATADALAQTSKVQPITIRAAISVISAAPILAIYPFLQKYFVTGMALGSVKG